VAEEENDDDLRARLDSLSTALDAQQKAAQDRKADSGPTDEAGRSMGRAMNLGFRVLTEFVAATVVGGLIGWKLDDWIGTSPLFLILFLALGTAAGFWSVYRIAAQPTGSSGGLK
jgi:ATP synthase protein I